MKKWQSMLFVVIFCFLGCSVVLLNCVKAAKPKAKSARKVAAVCQVQVFKLVTTKKRQGVLFTLSLPKDAQGVIVNRIALIIPSSFPVDNASYFIKKGGISSAAMLQKNRDQSMQIVYLNSTGPLSGTGKLNMLLVMRDVQAATRLVNYAKAFCKQYMRVQISRHWFYAVDMRPRRK